MKTLIASVAIAAACSLSATAFAQSNGSDNGSQALTVAAQSASTNSDRQSSHRWYSFLRHGANRNAGRDNACVGPASFCNVYFGS
ncbi:hypothetical protein [Trinickia sp. YCB016]